MGVLFHDDPQRQASTSITYINLAPLLRSQKNYNWMNIRDFKFELDDCGHNRTC